MSLTIDEYSIDIKQIIEFLEKLDVNDCIYYEYCKKNEIDLYTFDSDSANLNQKIIKVI